MAGSICRRIALACAARGRALRCPLGSRCAAWRASRYGRLGRAVFGPVPDRRLREGVDRRHDRGGHVVPDRPAGRHRAMHRGARASSACSSSTSSRPAPSSELSLRAFACWEACPAATDTCTVQGGQAGSVCAVFGDLPPESPCPPPYLQLFKKGDGKGKVTATSGGVTEECASQCAVGIWTRFAPNRRSR